MSPPLMEPTDSAVVIQIGEEQEFELKGLAVLNRVLRRWYLLDGKGGWMMAEATYTVVGGVYSFPFDGLLARFNRVQRDRFGRLFGPSNILAAWVQSGRDNTVRNRSRAYS